MSQGIGSTPRLFGRFGHRPQSPASGATAGEDVFQGLAPRKTDGGQTYSIRDVEAAVAARYTLTKDQMRGLGRARMVVRPRQIAMYLAREMTGQSLPRIGAHFCRDHTTVLHAVRAITRLMAKDPRIAADVEGCRELIARREPWRAQVAAQIQGTGAP